MITRIGRAIKGGIKNVAIGSKNKFVNFWTQLGADYKAAISDLGVVCQKKPIKASFYIGCGVILTRLYWTNPTVVNFRQNYIDFHHDLMLGWYFMSCENYMRLKLKIMYLRGRSQITLIRRAGGRPKMSTFCPSL